MTAISDDELRDKVVEIVALMPMGTDAKLTEIGWERYGENEGEAVDKLMSLIASHDREVRRKEKVFLRKLNQTKRGSEKMHQLINERLTEL